VKAHQGAPFSGGRWARAEEGSTPRQAPVSPCPACPSPSLAGFKGCRQPSARIVTQRWLQQALHPHAGSVPSQVLPRWGGPEEAGEDEEGKISSPGTSLGWVSGWGAETPGCCSHPSTTASCRVNLCNLGSFSLFSRKKGAISSANVMISLHVKQRLTLGMR